MKYTKIHLRDKTESILACLPYINLVMEGIIIEPGVKIWVHWDGGIELHKDNRSLTLFENIRTAMLKRTELKAKDYLGLIQLKEIETKKVKVIIKKTYQFKKVKNASKKEGK